MKCFLKKYDKKIMINEITIITIMIKYDLYIIMK